MAKNPPLFPDIRVEVTGPRDSVMARVCSAMRKAGQPYREIKDFRKRTLHAPDGHLAEARRTVTVVDIPNRQAG